MPIDNLSTVYTPKDTGSGQNVYGGLSQVFKPQEQKELDFTPLIADKQAKDKAERERAQEINDLFNPKLEETWLVERERLGKEYDDILKEATELHDKGELNEANIQRIKSKFERNNLNRKSSMTNYNASKKYRDFINQNADKIDYEAAKKNADKFDNPMNFPEIAEEIKEKYKGNTSLWRANNMSLLDVSPKKKVFNLQEFKDKNEKNLINRLASRQTINPETGKKWTVTDAVTDKQAKEHVDYLYKQNPEFKGYIDERYANEDYAKTFKSPSEFAQEILYQEFTKQRGFKEDETAQSRAKLEGDKSNLWGRAGDITHNVTSKDGSQYNYTGTDVRIINQDADPVNFSNTNIFSEETNDNLGSGSSDITVKKVYKTPTAKKDIYIDTRTGEKITPEKFNKAKDVTLTEFIKALPKKVKNRLIIDGKENNLTEAQAIEQAFNQQAKLNKGRYKKISSGQRILGDVVKYLDNTDYSNEEWGHGVAKNKKFLETSPIKLTETGGGKYLEDVKGNQYNKIKDTDGNVYAEDPSTNERYLFSGGKIQAPAYGATAEIDVYFKVKDNKSELEQAFGKDFFKEDEETGGGKWASHNKKQ